METVIIVIHLMVIVALVAVVLMQRSEGGALGIGGGGNFMSARSQGNVLTRTTAILALAFFATSIGLTVLSRFTERPGAILQDVPSAAAPVTPGNGTGTGTGTGGILDQIQGLNHPSTSAPSASGAGEAPTGAPAGAAPTTGDANSQGAEAPAAPQVPTSQ